MKVGIVRGPFYNGNYKFVEIFTFDENNKRLPKIKLKYQTYLKELEECKHNYIKPYWEDKGLVCQVCNNNFTTTRLIKGKIPTVCSVICHNKLKYKKNSIKRYKISLVFNRQSVIPIYSKRNTSDNQNKFFIVYEFNKENKGAYFVNQKDTTIFIDTDINGVDTYRLVYDLDKTCKVKLCKDHKKLFWITETGILISRRTRSIIKFHKSKKGYLVYTTYDNNNKPIQIKSHREVAKAFIPNPDNKPEINHKDGIKSNNYWTNLEWSTRLENIHHAYKLKLIVNKEGEENSNSKLSNTDVRIIRYKYKNKNITMKELGKEYNVRQQTISNVIRKESFSNVY